jgi:pyridoxal phosphate enzyme (YggS family)
MLIDENKYRQISQELKGTTIVAVSKTKSIEAIKALYDLGHRDFGENYVQELVQKQQRLPGDIRWHFIGHLQSNKVKQIAPFIHLIQSVDSLKLLKEVDKQGKRSNRTIKVLLQIHIAQEETKFGLDENELNDLMRQLNKEAMANVKICGLMGMASFTEDLKRIRTEFNYLKQLFDKFTLLFTDNCPQSILSMGMSSDYKVAVEEGSNMVRIGSLIFGSR